MSTKKDSVRQEKRGAKKYGGKVTPGSGNTPWAKNDMRTERESWEYKVTSAKSYTLKDSELCDAESNALLDGRDFRFGLQMCGRNWVLMSEEDYDGLYEAIELLKKTVNVQAAMQSYEDPLGLRERFSGPQA
jgi:hypothetical protein